MITSSFILTGDINVPNDVFYATTTGLSGGTPQQTAITTIAICNIETPDLSDETVNSSNISIFLNGSDRSNLIVNNLTVPAGETVFFSDERLILDGNDSIYIGATAGDTDTAGAFDIGSTYIIVNPGTTDFTAIGADNSDVDTVFTASGVGSGTGTARKILLTVTVSSLPV